MWHTAVGCTGVALVELRCLLPAFRAAAILDRVEEWCSITKKRALF